LRVYYLIPTADSRGNLRRRPEPLEPPVNKNV
jgi:hypothetical protein